MAWKISLLAFVLGLYGCASVKSDTGDNNNKPAGACDTVADCNEGQVCCETPGSPVIGGEILTVCSSPDSCCNCYGEGTCDRCQPDVEECFMEGGIGECQPVPCTYPSCTTSEDCPTDELCCTELTGGCDGCLGSCVDPASESCTTLGWECGGGPYASAQEGPWGAWMRHHRIVPLPVDAAGVATVSATFRWKHDAGRPPPHDLAIGAGASRAPVFQVFGRSGRAYARFGLQLVPLERQAAYRISMTLEPAGETTRARAELLRLRDHKVVLSRTARIDSPVRSIWREQLGPAGHPVGARVDLREFWVRSGRRSGRSVAQRAPTTAPGVCGTSI